MLSIEKIQLNFLNDHYIKVIEKINNYYEEGRGFILGDLLDCDDVYYRYMTKGILLALIDLEYIKIISNYNGYKNYVYLPLKKLDLKNKSIGGEDLDLN